MTRRSEPIIFTSCLILLFFLSIVRAEKCKLLDYCQANGVCRDYKSLEEISQMAKECLKADEQTLFNLFKYRNSYQRFTQIDFMMSTEQDVNNKFDIHVWKWIMYNNKKQLNQTNIESDLVIWNVAQIDYAAYSSEYINRDYGGFEFNLIKIQISKSQKFNQIECGQNSSSWRNFLDSTTRALEIVGGKHLNYLCPLWFQRVEIASMTLINNGGFKFKKVDHSVKVSCNISKLTLDIIHRLTLDQDVLTIFGNLTNLIISGSSLLSISPTSLFQDFSLLKNLEISIINFGGFLHSVNGTEWMSYLNNRTYLVLDQFLTKSINETEYQYILESAMTLSLTARAYENSLVPFNWYIYPDEDLCLFRNFPHYHLVVPLIKSFDTINCTCTLVWLLKYNSLVYQKNNFSFLEADSLETYFDNHIICDYQDIDKFEKLYDSCNMTHRLDICSIQDVPTSHDPYFDIYDLKKGLEDAHLYLLTYSGPVVCSIGTVTNLIIVIVILHNKHSSPHNKPATKKSKDIVLLDERLYQLMFINAIINLIYCFMYLLDFSITCTPIEFNDFSLSEDMIKKQYTFVNCLNKDIAIGFIGSSLKMISNTLLVFISINRFILIGKDHKKFVLTLSSVSNKALMISSSVFSCLLSVIVIFQYTTWSNSIVVTNQTVLYAYDSYPFYYNSILRMESVVKRLDQITVITTFSVIHDFFSYLLFCIIILILDVATVKKLKETLAQKTAIAKNAENQESKEKAEQKSITMVCINSAVNFFLRLPEILSMICFIFFDVNPYIYKMLCVMYSRCLSLYDLSNVVYILSLSTPLLFYLGFNNNFFNAFQALQNSCKPKNSQNIKIKKTVKNEKA